MTAWCFLPPDLSLDDGRTPPLDISTIKPWDRPALCDEIMRAIRFARGTALCRAKLEGDVFTVVASVDCEPEFRRYFDHALGKIDRKFGLHDAQFHSLFDIHAETTLGDCKCILPNYLDASEIEMFESLFMERFDEENGQWLGQSGPDRAECA